MQKTSGSVEGIRWSRSACKGREAWGNGVVNFTCQLDWATVADTWSNTILGMSARAFQDEFNIGIDGLSKADCPPQCGWASAN